jgi:beta-glucosidase
MTGLPTERRFPEGFLWGTATSAYQIEGAVDEDGRGPSIWDTFVRTPGKMLVEGTGDVACDHYHRYAEDVALMTDLGATAYRFSISWPRIFPGGTGEPNAKGMDFYSRLVDELLANGIEPFATLYHWDMPQALQDRGGWQARDTSQAFAEYAGYVAGQLGDRVRHFSTLNELSMIVDGGHATGLMAPGRQLPSAAVNQVRHHALLAHGLAVQAIRASGGPGARVGTAEDFKVPAPFVETAANVRAAEIALRELNAGYLTVILEGRYTDAFLVGAGADAPMFTDEDLQVIVSPLDFVGVNIYKVDAYVRAIEEPPGYETFPFATTHPHAASWHRISPEAMYWGPRLLQSVWNPAEIYVTENGCSSAGAPDGGDLVDTDRVTFMRSYLGELQRATTEGVRVRGYFHWSLMDNFEWTAAYANRYGVVHVDFGTQKRTPKLSASYFREVVARNAVV